MWLIISSLIFHKVAIGKQTPEVSLQQIQAFDNMRRGPHPPQSIPSCHTIVATCRSTEEAMAPIIAAAIISIYEIVLRRNKNNKANYTYISVVCSMGDV